MSEDGKGAEAGQGEGSGGSSPQMVPLDALKAERGHRQDLERQLADLKGQVDSLKEKPKEYTRAELQDAVGQGKISQERADQILEDQTFNRHAERMREETQAERLKDKISQQIAAYQKARPGIMEEGSADRDLVAAEYRRQVSEYGKPDNVQTELDALMACFGPASRLQNGRREIETHRETGSDGGGDGESDKAPKLPAHVKAHYEKQIGMGMYSGWEDERLKQEVDQYGGRWR